MLGLGHVSLFTLPFPSALMCASESVPDAGASATEQHAAGPSVTEQHAAWFSTCYHELTEESMTYWHRVLGITARVGFKIRAILGLCTSHRCPFTAAGIASIPNPARSGIWTAAGHFDEKRFEMLESLAKPCDATQRPCVTRATFDQLINHSATDTAVWVWVWKVIPIPLSWIRITQASLDELFGHFADCTLNDEPAITIASLRVFYTDPHAFFDRAASHSRRHGHI
jgi:hypothetical protein